MVAEGRFIVSFFSCARNVPILKNPRAMNIDPNCQPQTISLPEWMNTTEPTDSHDKPARDGSAHRVLVFNSVVRECLRETKAAPGENMPSSAAQLHTTHLQYGKLALAVLQHRQQMRQTFQRQLLEGRRDNYPQGLHSPRAEVVGVLISPYWLGDFTVREIDLYSLLMQGSAPSAWTAQSANTQDAPALNLGWLLRAELELQQQLPAIVQKGGRDAHVAFSIPDHNGSHPIPFVVSLDDKGQAITSIFEDRGNKHIRLGGLSAGEVALQYAALEMLRVPPMAQKVSRLKALADMGERAQHQAPRKNNGQHEIRPMLLNEYEARGLQRANTDTAVQEALIPLLDAQMLTYSAMLIRRRDNWIKGLSKPMSSDPGLEEWMLRHTKETDVHSPRWHSSAHPFLPGPEMT